VYIKVRKTNKKERKKCDIWGKKGIGKSEEGFVWFVLQRLEAAAKILTNVTTTTRISNDHTALYKLTTDPLKNMPPPPQVHVLFVCLPARTSLLLSITHLPSTTNHIIIIIITITIKSNTRYHPPPIMTTQQDHEAQEAQEAQAVKKSVSDYYGKKLTSTADLKTTACCAATVPKKLRKLLKDIHPDVLARFYGCGSPLPEGLEGCTVLDIGSGSGRDCYVASKLVGPHGKVIGVDMTDEQLAVARKHVEWHTKKYGYDKPNVTFVKGVIEDLTTVGIKDASVDVCVSNCVLNLSPNKPQVLAGM
jgi:2-polyprenyl-3-methyl-5-hydroxy-6-metoxy-1,4-benzoquinol methylase